MAGTRLGRYDFIKTLVKGELTDLLLGRASGKEGFQRHVAIKLLRSEHAKDAGCLEAFVNEARLAAALHHHNIVQVLDIGEEGGQPYFAMEYVHGVDLRTLLSRLAKRNEQLPLPHVVAIVASAAAALHHAHEQKGPDGKSLGIVHRDVTPANILVGFDGNVKVVDFGIAKAAIRRMQTARGVLKGRVPYMAPEQCAGKPVDRRSDVFALGIVLFELATVRRLFKGATEFLTMSAIVNGEIPKPSQYRRDVPAELETIMMKALASDPGTRFQSCGDMALELDKVATKVGVGASTSALASYMRLQFGDVQEPWLTEVDQETTDVDFDGGASGLAPPHADSVKNNAIPKTIEASRSSPIAQVRDTPSRPNKVNPVARPEPVAKPAHPLEAAAPVSIENRARAALPRPNKPSKPPIDKSFSVPTIVNPPVPEVNRPGTDDEQVPTQRAARTAVASPPPPPEPTEEKTTPGGRRQSLSDGIDPTEIVAPLPAMPTERPVVRRIPVGVMPLVPTKPKPIILWIGLLVGALVLAAGVVVMWPGDDAAPAAAPASEQVAQVEPEQEEEKKEEATEPSEPAPGMQATMADYERAREAEAAKKDAAKAKAEAEEKAKLEAEAKKTQAEEKKAAAKAEAENKRLAAKAAADAKKAEAAENKAAAAAAKKAEAEEKKAATAAKKPDEEKKTAAKTKPAIKRAAAKTSTKTTAAKRPKTTAKKTTKKKWNPDDLFLGD